MSNSRKIVIRADALDRDSPVDIQTSQTLFFKRGDDLKIEATFLQNGLVADMSGAQEAVLEILDIGAFNSPQPRTVSLLMRKVCSTFSTPVCDESGALDEDSQSQVPHCVFEFSNLETQIASGEKWITIRVKFTDESKITFCAGWVKVDDNFLSDPELLPIENPQYIKRAEAGELYLNKSGNLSDLNSKPLARTNLDVYSKSETDSVIAQNLEFLPAYETSLNTIKSAAISAKDSALLASLQSSQALTQIGTIKSEVETMTSQVALAKVAAETARDEALAFVDTDGALAKADLEIKRLQSAGSHFLRGGYLKFPSTRLKAPFTLFAKIKSDFVGTVFQKANLSLSVASGGIFTLTDGENSYTSSAQSGEFLNLALVIKESSASLFCNLQTCVLNATSFNFIDDNGSFTIGDSSTCGEISNVSILNFAADSETCEYSISDFFAGKAIPPTLNRACDVSSATNSAELSAAGFPTYAPRNTCTFESGVGLVSTVNDVTAAHTNGYTWTNFYVKLPIKFKQGDLLEIRLNEQIKIQDGTTLEAGNNIGNVFTAVNYSQKQQIGNGFTTGTWYALRLNSTSEGGSHLQVQYTIKAKDAWATTSRVDKFDFDVKINGAYLKLSSVCDAYQIKDLSETRNHATIFGNLESAKKRDISTMCASYSWGTDVSTGAYVMGDTPTIPPNCEVEILAKASESATLNIGTSSSAASAFASNKSVGTSFASLGKFYTLDSAQKLFITPSVAGLTLNFAIKSIKLN